MKALREMKSPWAKLTIFVALSGTMKLKAASVIAHP